MSHNRK